MKSWIGLLVIGAAVIGVLGRETDIVFLPCAKKTGVTVDQLVMDQKNGMDISTADRNVQCYYGCYAHNRGWITNNNEIVADRILRPADQIPQKLQETRQRVKDECLKESSDVCATGYFIIKCISELMEKHQQQG